MRAILLAAGLGTRLRPLTHRIPKCLVPVRGKPLLETWLERLTEAGIGPFLINTHYLAKRVEDFFEANIYRDKVTLAYEPELLGTAGTLVANLDFCKGEAGMLIHADNYCLADFRAFMEAHNRRPPECLMTLISFRTEMPSSCGILECDHRGVVVGFHEKVNSSPGNLANGAVYILSAKFLEMLRRDLSYVKDFSTEILNRFIGRIYTYETAEVFWDIGTLEAYTKANDFSEAVEV